MNDVIIYIILKNDIKLFLIIFRYIKKKQLYTQDYKDIKETIR